MLFARASLVEAGPVFGPRHRGWTAAESMLFTCEISRGSLPADALENRGFARHKMTVGQGFLGSAFCPMTLLKPIGAIGNDENDD
jgi:hypothetical protein